MQQNHSSNNLPIKIKVIQYLFWHNENYWYLQYGIVMYVFQIFPFLQEFVGVFIDLLFIRKNPEHNCLSWHWFELCYCITTILRTCFDFLSLEVFLQRTNCYADVVRCHLRETQLYIMFLLFLLDNLIYLIIDIAFFEISVQGRNWYSYVVNTRGWFSVIYIWASRKKSVY